MTNVDLGFLLELNEWRVLLIIIAGILLDAVIGILTTFRADHENFDIRKLPRFIATGIFPYVGGLTAVAVVSNQVGPPYDYVFYGFAVPVLAKYVADIIDKLKTLFGVEKDRRVLEYGYIPPDENKYNPGGS